MMDAAPADGIAFSPEEELRAYRQMLLIRRFEEKAGQLYALGAIRGACQLSIGQEASIVGMEMAAAHGDCLIAGRRCHGHILARGLSPKLLMAELLGRRSGLAGGAGGAMEVRSPAHGYFGGHPVRGGQAPIGAGLAFAQRYRSSSHVTLCFMGDGAAGKGIVHETMRLSALWRLPVVFLIDNNTPSPQDHAPSIEGPLALAERGSAFGIPYETVDAIDVRKVRAAGSRAIARVRAGEGPALLELQTHPYRGHAAAPVKGGGTDRKREDTDPIAKARARILNDHIASEAQMKKLDKSIKDEITAAAAFARAEPAPEARPGLPQRHALAL